MTAPVSLEAPRERMLPWPKVREVTGLSRATAWRRQKDGDFPAPVQLSPNRVAWRESDVLRWLASRAPRSEPHPVVSARVRPPRQPLREPVAAAAPVKAEPPPAASVRGRAAKPSPSQIAFDFG